MRKITKLLTLALAALMIMSVMPVSAAFTDVSVDDEALSDAVELLSTLGVAKGTTDTTFGPEELVTRQQMAAFVYRLMKAGRSSEGGVNTTAFADLEDSTFFNMISWAANAGIIKGTSATTFNPKGNITLQDAYVMVVRALGYEKDGALVYPHGYVDQAEALGLDEDIPSSVNYTDNLNRGQVAIILANAFYAEMNEKTVKYDWVYDTANGKKPTDGSDAQATYVAKEVTTTIAEKIFGVVEETLVVEATTHYSFDGAKVTYDEKLNGVETVRGTRYREDGEAVETTVDEYELVKDLGLTGAADDYFMAEITLFVKKDADKAEDDEILAAKSNLVKKTVKADKVVLERSTKSGEEYYIEGDKENEKVLTGYAEFDGIKAYLDINVAPRSVDKEEVDSLKFINLTDAKWDEDGNNEFDYEATTESYDGVYGVGADGKTYDKLDTAIADNAEAAMYRVYTEGLYEADVYDVDGDNYADYLFVKNYKLAKIVDHKSYKYNNSKNDDDKIYNIYTKEVVIDGEYKSDDYVLVYAPSKDIQYIKVADKVESFDSKVTGKSTSAETFTFANGTVVNYVDNEAKGGMKLEETEFTTGKEYTVFVKDGVVLHSGNISEIEFDLEASYALVTGEKVNATEATKYHAVFNQETGKSTYYVNAIIDGESKNVKLGATVNVYEDKKLTSKKINKESVETYFGDEGLFNGKIAIYKVVDGAYVFTEVRYTDGAVNFKSDDAASVLFDVTGEVVLKNVSGSIYEDVSDSFKDIEKFYVKNFTKFILKTEDKKNKGEYIWTVYTAETLPKFAETTFKNVKAVFVNNTASESIEDLVLFYADATKFGSGAVAEDYYKVIGMSERADENDEPETIYTLLNIKTGEKKSDVLAAADVVGIKLDDYVQLDKVGEIDSVEEAVASNSYEEVEDFDDYVLVTGIFENYDEDSRLLEIKGDDKDYVVAEDVTVFIYNTYKSNNYGKADIDALDTEANPYELLEAVNEDYDGDKKTLNIDFIGEVDKNNKDIIVVTAIVLSAK